MNTLLVTALVLISVIGFAALGYLVARMRAAGVRGRLETDLRVAEERAQQSAAQAGELRVERDAATERADRLEHGQAEQWAERRGQDERTGRLEADLTAVRGRLDDANGEIERLRTAITGRQQECETSGRELRERETRIVELLAIGERHREEIAEYKERLAELQAEQQSLREKAAALDGARQELDQSREENNRLQRESFQALAADLLAKSEEKLVSAADGKLTATSAAVREQLGQLDGHLRRFDTQRASADAQLKQQISHLAEETAKGREQTRSLVEALRRPQVRGAWGEMHLKRSVELAGMQEHCDFATQVQIEGEEGRLRPDMVVNLAGGKSVVVDAKVPLTAFLAATEAGDEAERERRWAQHAKQLRKHVDTLASKDYARNVPGSPEFVVMYLPGEALLQPAVERDAQLMEYAASKRVFIAGPTTLMTMLRTIAFSWTQAALQDNLREVYELGRELYERLGKLGGHLASLGTNLDRSVNAYNRAVGSLESRVLVTARRFQTLKVTDHELATPGPVEQTTRPLGSPSWWPRPRPSAWSVHCRLQRRIKWKRLPDNPPYRQYSRILDRDVLEFGCAVTKGDVTCRPPTAPRS